MHGQDAHATRGAGWLRHDGTFGGLGCQNNCGLKPFRTCVLREEVISGKSIGKRGLLQ